MDTEDQQAEGIFKFYNNVPLTFIIQSHTSVATELIFDLTYFFY